MVKQGTVDMLRISSIFLRAAAGATNELCEFYERKLKGSSPPTAEEEKKIDELEKKYE